jgi:hypothetical protein
VLPEEADLAGGTVVRRVSVRPTACALLSAIEQAGWRAHIDGRPVAGEVVMPGPVGPQIEPSTDTAISVDRGDPDGSARLVLVTAGPGELAFTDPRGRSHSAKRASRRHSHDVP